MKKTAFTLSVLSAAMSAALPATAQTARTVELPVVTVSGHTGQALSHLLPDDTALLLSNEPGYSVAANGFSGFPVVNGLADDRLKIRVDGMEMVAACGNHMNPPLSYLAPRQTAKISLLTGATPVSAGGDNIGGVIEVQSVQPVFAAAGEGLFTSGQLSITGRSVNHGVTAGVRAVAASDAVSLTYSASRAKARSYKAGGGATVLDTLYKNVNQSALIGLRIGEQLVTLQVGEQRIPYQGIPNQYMDMVEDRGRFANAGYEAQFGALALRARAYWQSIEHEMGPFTDEKMAMMMPMLTHGRNRGYSVEGTIDIGADSRVVVGHAFHVAQLNDLWPGMEGSMMMGPQDYVRINAGTRSRAALFGEWRVKPADRWSVLAGVRSEHVRSDTGIVQPYNTGMMNAADAMAAMAFNERSRARRDDNFDATALARFDATPNSSFELGLARKTRSPNLYERYSWGRGAMSMTMTNWFGDANGYVGDPDLKPEVAATLNGVAEWRGQGKAWQLKVNPYYTRVADFIDTDVIGATSVNLLRFASHDATLYGVNLSASVTQGPWTVRGKAAYTHGERDDGIALYRIMPLNGALEVRYQHGALTGSAELAAVARKTRVDAHRREPKTPGYGLLNLQTTYQFSRMARVVGGVSNVFDKAYALPQGGVYLADYVNRRAGPLAALPGQGRSIDLGAVIDF